MATYFYGSDGLIEAITASSRSVTTRMACDSIRNAYSAAGLDGVKQLASEYGINYITYADKTTPAAWVVESFSGATPASAEVLYPAVLDSSIDTVANEVVYTTASQVTTEGGSTLLAGAVKTATSWLPLVGAIATGVGLGWESYKEHPDAWTDLSEAIFNSDDPQTPVEVIARAKNDGYVTGVKEKELARVIQKLTEEGCFDYRSYESDIEGTGTQSVFWSSVPALGQGSSLAIAYAHEHYPDYTVIYSESDYLRDDRYLEGTILIAETATLPETANVGQYTDSKGNPYYGVPLSCMYIMAQYDLVTEQTSYYTNTGTNTIPSGEIQIRVQDRHAVGGLSCTIVTHDADNELFTNDHGSGILMIAPDASISDIIDALRDQYPDWYDDSWVQTEYNPETDSEDENRYYPVTIPWWNPSTDPETPPDYTPEDARKGDIKQDPDPKAEPQGQTATENNDKYETDPELEPDVPVVPPTDTPSDPSAGTGEGAAGLWNVYNPTSQELSDLGAYLWASNIIDIIQKFLQNPMDAIISLHRIYCTPITGTPAHIMLGYLDSGVSAKTVTNQFVTVNCGSVTVPEYFEDARDYDSPYTIVEAYLPFCGIVRLRSEDIIGGTVNIVYTIDVYSGACLCKIFVTKLGAKQLLYNYSGNCSMQIPLTGSDRTRLLSGAVSGAITGAFMGAQVGAIVGAVGGAFMGGTSIDRSGQFSANAGCMGVKIPYLIITRKYAYDAGNYNHFYGYPSNNTVSLGSCHGFTRVRDLHIETVPVATDSEKAEIERLLRQGVVIK